MLYVFLVNTGNMLTLDMALTMESVQRLQETLALVHNLPIDKQVLLISGGQSLDPHIRVCSYSAGTDTNPIFLFSKGTIESVVPPNTPLMLHSKEEKLRLQVEGLKNLPHSYSAVVARTQLALQFHDLAKENLRLCECLVHDQHLQQQGWMAVVANLEDITSAFEQRAGAFRQSMTEFLQERPLFITQLAEFPDVLMLLEKTPLLPCLLDEGSVVIREWGVSVTLMQWISSQDQRSTLQQMAQQCSKSLDQFNQQVLDAMSSDINTTLDAVNNGSMKEVKGLGERLFGLEQLLTSAQKVLQEQAEMAQGMVQNQARASNLNDSSVLPDLCKSHQQQLSVMYKKHCQLAEISRRCQVAKDELCHNLHVRLRWIMYVEQQISAVHSKMVVYHENLKRLRKRLEIVRQVYTAPKLYATAVVEVCRRRNYASQFTTWAGKVCESSLTSHQSELAKRREFASSIDRHFLNVLFPGLIGEIPPIFATTPPGDFDTRLPDISVKDIDTLREKLPELSHVLVIPQEESLTKDDSAAVSKRPTRTSLSDEQTQTSLCTQEIVVPDLRSYDSEITVLDKEGESLEAKSRGTALLRPDSLPDGMKFLSMDLAKAAQRATPHSPDSLQSMSLQPVETFVSAATTPDLALSPLDVSTRGETPFASLLTAPEGTFYSAVTSPLEETDSPSNNQVIQSKTDVAKELELLQESLEEKEAQLFETQQRFAEVKSHLEERDSQLESTRAEKTQYEDKWNVSKTGVRSVVSKLETAVLKLKEECSEMKRSIGDEKVSFNKTVDEIVSRVGTCCEKVQTFVNDEQSKSICTAKEQLQGKWGTETKNFEKNVEKLNEKINSLTQTLQETRVALVEKEKELVTVRETNSKDLAMLKSQMEQEITEKLASMEFQKQKEIDELLAAIKEKDDAVKMMKETTEEELYSMKERHDIEKQETVEVLRLELTTKHEKNMEAKVRDLQDIHLEELSELKTTTELRVDAACKELRQALEEDTKEELQELKTNLEKEHRCKLCSLSEEIFKRISGVQENYSEAREDIRQELMLMKVYQEELMESSQLRMSKMEESFVIERESTSVTAVEVDPNLKESGSSDEILPSDSNDRTPPLSLEKDQLVLMAGRQHAFNEAVSRVAATKDKTIEELQQSVAQLRGQRSRDQDTIEKLLADKGDLDKELTNALHEAHRSEKNTQAALKSSEAQVAHLQEKLRDSDSKNSGPAQLLVSNERDTMQSTSATEGRLQALLRSKEQECSALKHQVMQLRVSAGSSSRSEKISIIDISVGDLVLIFFEEPRDNYVVFSIEPTLYFVHSESLSGLDLKHHGSEGPKRQWIIGRVTDKEYCQAKKANNRFKVAIGTKFYRVKARRYDVKQEQETATK